MKINNNKGFSLIELLVALLIMALLSTLLTTLLMFGFDSFRVYSNFSKQQDKIVDSMRKLKKDIEQSSKITVYETVGATVAAIKIIYPDGNTQRVWRFNNDSLELGIQPNVPTITTATAFSLSVADLDSSNCRFIYNITDKRLSVMVKPKASNTGKFVSKNMNEQIITDFSVRYKDVEPVSLQPNGLPINEIY